MDLCGAMGSLAFVILQPKNKFDGSEIQIHEFVMTGSFGWVFYLIYNLYFFILYSGTSVGMIVLLMLLQKLIIKWVNRMDNSTSSYPVSVMEPENW